MKFFGTGSSTLKKKKTREVKCPNCGMDNETGVQSITKRFYVFWIPVFPLKKEFYLTCHHCKGVYNKYNMHKEKYREINLAVRYGRTPVRKYRPVFILALVLILTFLAVQFGR
ncbi:zinc-ribbon domain-containing protein [Sinomicrobium weinanense]|uniref:Zinc-ribbon domain-containing protein n=1 Tax=Sinomicrobium weinanense TaxID=2842200 RepID=A0A926JUC6_9FLAO|nr:zinc-ribbon domain-containing protein [Sinomicrobium weinanense]MBC9797700.1 zinc-ribbon domain-containing protein [Sinomicrobium weinanense]MBU3122274.1 zinc ribbon domain-containing protein [Sinomicrobium weinanense]